MLQSRSVRPNTRVTTLAILPGELVLSAVALALAWRIRLTSAEFAGQFSQWMPNAVILITAVGIVLFLLMALGRDGRSISTLTMGALAGPLLGAAWIWNEQGLDGLPRGVAGSFIWIYFLLGLAWRSAWILHDASAWTRPEAEGDEGAGGLELRDVSRKRTLGLFGVIAHRELLRNLVIKDLKLKYRGSVLGFVWSLLNPLIMTAIYTLAFIVVIGVTQRAFVMYLLLGLLAWNYFVVSASMSTGSIIDSGSFVKGVYFPRLILPLATVLFNLSQYLLTTVVFLPMMLIFYQVTPTPMMLLFPVVVGLQTVFTFGVAMALSAGTAKFRDVRHFLEIALQVIFWTTPIVYEVAGRPAELRSVLMLSPMAPFISIYHDLFYYQSWPDAAVWMTCLLYTATAFLGGAALFTSCEENFAEQF